MRDRGSVDYIARIRNTIMGMIEMLRIAQMEIDRIAQMEIV